MVAVALTNAGPSKRRGSRREAAGLAMLVVAIASCGGGTPAGRGFGSREVLPIRDLTFNFAQSSPATIGYTTTDDGPIVRGTIELTTGQDAGTSGGADAGAGPRYVCELSEDATTQTERVTITDTQTNQQTVIDDVFDVVRFPSTDPTLTFLRSDASGARTLWSGPFDAIEQIPLPVAITARLYPVGSTGDVLAVLGVPTDQPSALGIFSIDLDTFAVTTLVPPTLGTAAWASGASATTAKLASTSLLEQALVSQLGAQYSYVRTMDDGSTIVFAGTFPNGPASELALFQVSPSMGASEVLEFASSHSGTLFWTEIWQVSDSTGQNASLMVWDNGHQQLLSCPAPPQPAAGDFVLSRDGRGLLYGVSSPSAPPQAVGGSVTLVSLSNGAPGSVGSCATLPSTDIIAAGFSSDSSSVFWLAQPPSGDPTLWTAAADGSGARAIGTGKISQPRYATGTELEFELGGDLLWVDTNDSSNHLNPIAEQIFGTAIDLQGPWLVIGYDFSTQDGTGLLGLVNRDTGTKRLVSPEVATYIEAVDPYAADGLIPDVSDGGVSVSRQIVYLVRGRNPSPQDGVWVATFSQADLH